MEEGTTKIAFLWFCGFFDQEEIISLIKTEETQEPEEPGCFKIIKTILFRSC